MATESEVLPPGTDVALYVAETPANMFQVQSLPELLFKRIEEEVAAFVPDLSTATSRAEIAALSFKIARTKTAVDKGYAPRGCSANGVPSAGWAA